MRAGSRTPWIVALIGGGLLMLGPVFGLLGTVIGLLRSFSETDPSMKASQLAEGISQSMNATAIGLAVFPIGAILTGVWPRENL